VCRVPPLGRELSERDARFAWLNAQADWEPIEVVGGVLQERAVAQPRAFPWSGGAETEV
jgi:hypothetical protein